MRNIFILMPFFNLKLNPIPPSELLLDFALSSETNSNVLDTVKLLLTPSPHSCLVEGRGWQKLFVRDTRDYCVFVLESLSIVVLDIAKFFDQIWHAALWYKFPHYGLHPKLCRLTNFLSWWNIQGVVDGLMVVYYPQNQYWCA